MAYINSLKKRHQSAHDILANLVPNADKHVLSINKDIIERKIIFDKDENFHYTIALAFFKEDVTKEFDVFDSDITEEDIKKAFELYGEELGLPNHTPILWNKEKLWNRCATMAGGNMFETVYFFSALYRGKDDDAFSEFLVSKLRSDI